MVYCIPVFFGKDPELDVRYWDRRAAKKIHIRDVATKVNIPEENLIPYGHDAAKINFDFIEKSKSNPDGKLILVTAINPTPAGEG